MYATPVVEGKTVVATVIPPGSITQRARLGSSPRSSRSRSTSCRAPSISTNTTRRPSVRLDPTVPPGAGSGSMFASAYQATFKSPSRPLAIPPNLTRCDHLLQQDRTLDRRGEHVAARVRNQPTLPLERVECLLQGRTVEPGGTGQATRVYTLFQGGRRTERLLRGLGERAESPADDADDGWREVAGEGVDECPVRGRPGRRIGRRRESRGHGLEHRDHKERESARVALHPARQTLRVIGVVSRERPAHQLPQCGRVEPSQTDDRTFEIAAQPGAQLIQPLALG